MHETLEATFRIVTPMFIGGADQSPSDGIRPPSVKGALRFWWRALNWGVFRQKQGSDDASALQALHDEEVRLFGGSAEQGGQGVFLLSVRHEAVSPISSIIQPFTGKAYLAGMGLGGPTVLPTEKNFVISLRFRPRITQTVIQNIEEAVRVFGLVGGLGSRSRRGFGSVVGLVRNGDNWRLPTERELEADCDWMKTKFSCGGTSPFSALDANTLFYRSNTDFNNVDAVLEDVGKLMNRYRTSGTSVIKKKDGRVVKTASAGHRIVGGDEVKETDLFFYETDHHQVHAIASTQSVAAPYDVPPERSSFGLPHPYRFSSLDGKKVSFDYKPGKEKGRRASPLLVHIATFTNGQGQIRYRPLLLLLQATFLPAAATLSVSVDGKNIGTVPSPTDYTPVKTFLSTHFAAC
ncbi:MAG: type III-B CRISPR module RAMP protein Cmr1 [Gammaproteobacteria bacterium]